MYRNDGNFGDMAGTGGGQFSRAMFSVNGRMVPYAKMAVFGQGITNFGDNASWSLRRFLMQYATHLIDDYGTNDDAAGATATAVLVAKKAMWAYFRSVAQGSKHTATTSILP